MSERIKIADYFSSEAYNNATFSPTFLSKYFPRGQHVSTGGYKNVRTAFLGNYILKTFYSLLALPSKVPNHCLLSVQDMVKII